MTKYRSGVTVDFLILKIPVFLRLEWTDLGQFRSSSPSFRVECLFCCRPLCIYRCCKSFIWCGESLVARWCRVATGPGAGYPSPGPGARRAPGSVFHMIYIGGTLWKFKKKNFFRKPDFSIILARSDVGAIPHAIHWIFCEFRQK